MSDLTKADIESVRKRFLESLNPYNYNPPSDNDINEEMIKNLLASTENNIINQITSDMDEQTKSITDTQLGNIQSLGTSVYNHFLNTQHDIANARKDIQQSYKNTTKNIRDVYKSVDTVSDKITDTAIKLNGVDTKLSGIDTKFNGVNTKLSGVDTKLSGVDTKLTDMDNKTKKILYYNRIKEFNKLADQEIAYRNSELEEEGQKPLNKAAVKKLKELLVYDFLENENTILSFFDKPVINIPV